MIVALSHLHPMSQMWHILLQALASNLMSKIMLQTSSTQPHSPAVESNINEEATSGLNAQIGDLQTTAEFIEALRTATLKQSNMHKKDIERLCEAPQHFPKKWLISISPKPYGVSSLQQMPSQATYNGFRDACQACYPGNSFYHSTEWNTRLRWSLVWSHWSMICALTHVLPSQAHSALSRPVHFAQNHNITQGQEMRVSNFWPSPLGWLFKPFIIHWRQQKRCTIERTLPKPFSSMPNKMAVGWKNTMTQHVQGNTLMPAVWERSRMVMWQFRYLSMVLSSMQIRTQTVGYSSTWFTTSPLTYGTRNTSLYLLASLVVWRSQNIQTLIFILPSPIFLLCKRRVWRSGMHGLTHIFPSPFNFLCWLLPMGLPWQMHVAMLDIVENVTANYSVHFLDNAMMETGTTSPFCKTHEL